MNERIEEQPYDLRHDTPMTPRNAVAELDVTGHGQSPMGRIPDMGEHIGNDHQAPVWTEETSAAPPATEYFRRPEAPLPSRVPGRGLFEEIPMAQPVTQHGLQWHSGDGTVRHNLAGFPWENNRRIGVDTSNVELRTIHAHLMEAIALARAEMRERGMVVDF